jgi:hypothetical protein
LCASGALSRAKSSLVVASCLFPDEAVLHYELWRVCCASGDSSHAARALGQACKNDALLEAFSTQLVADLHEPGSACGKGWLQGEERQVEKLVSRCIAKIQLSRPSADQSEMTWRVMMQLAEMTADMACVWWAAAELALQLDRALEGGIFNIRPVAALQGGGGGGEGEGADRLCNVWSERLAAVCLPQILSAKPAFSSDEVYAARSFWREQSCITWALFFF